MFSNQEEITKDVICSTNVADLKSYYLHDYIFPRNAVIGNAQLKKRTDAAVFIHLFYDDLVETCFPFIRETTKICDVYITTSKAVIRAYIEMQCKFFNIDNCFVKIVQNRGYDIASLVVHHRESILHYKYFCFTHDKKSSHMQNQESAHIRFMSLWENTVATASFITNVLQCFDIHPLLGFLTVPLHFIPEWLCDETKYWAASYQDVELLAKSLGLKCRLSPNKSCISVETAFWARTEAVSLLFERRFSLDDFPQKGVWNMSYAIERIFPYIAQHNGFYTGTVINDEFESYRSNFLYSACLDFASFIRFSYPDVSFTIIKKYLNFLSIYNSVRNTYSKIYIYGAGKIAEKFITICTKLFKLSFDSIVVSDGHRTQPYFMKYNVLEFSEIKNNNECFFIIALSKKNMVEVLSLLNAKACSYWCYD